ncbi:MAG: TFIIB-type zinc ribbon-containing protein [Acidimicrobiia bacterium]|nr:TFIIB-type zinc ribbon-containing protein [Acidimicrobiia bacterium]
MSTSSTSDGATGPYTTDETGEAAASAPTSPASDDGPLPDGDVPLDGSTPGSDSAASPADAPDARSALGLPTESTVNTANQRLEDGVNRCPRCGATDIVLRTETGMLSCLFCRYEWNEDRLDSTVATGNVDSLTGTTIGTGAKDIQADVDSVVTMKCQGCGAEVVVNISEQMSARCHWCRHVLTVNEQIPNGAVPDAVLPFKVTHAQAVEIINQFAGKRRTFADRTFLREFTPENIVGVYMPYMVVDAKASADVAGFGEIQTARYTRGTGDNKTTYYDADVYAVERHVDFTVDDLTIEASMQRADMNTAINTNNVINTILPFDTENAVKWNAAYLTGFTSEKRDQDVSNITPELENQLLSIARSQVVASIAPYDRGVRWEGEALDVAGTRWLAMYLPVWLYSYYHEKNGKGMVHYISVNGRTGEVMGSVPVSTPRLLAASLTVGTVLEGLVLAFLVGTS